MSRDTDIYEDTNRVSWLDRLYTFVVISCAAVLLALAFWPGLTNQISIVESAWKYRHSDGAGGFANMDLGEIERAIKSPESVINAIDLISPSINDRNYSTWEKKVVENVSVSLEPKNDSELDIRIRAGGQNEEFSKELVKTLQEQFHKQFHRPVDSEKIGQERSKLESNVVNALRRLDKTQLELDRFLQKRMQEERTRTSAQVPEDATRLSSGDQNDSSLQLNPVASATPTPLPSKDRLPTVESVNPEYTSIQNEIESLRGLTASLANPSGAGSSQSVEIAIRELESKLARTPRVLQVKSEWLANPFTNEGKTTSIQNPFVDNSSNGEDASNETENEPSMELAQATFDAYAVEQSIKNSKEYKQILRSVDQAKERHAAALVELASAPDAASMASSDVELLKPATTVGRFRSAFEKSSLFKILLPAALLGAIAVAFLAKEQIPTTFYSGQDAARWLDMPVVGSVTTDRGPAVSKPWKAQRSWVRWLRHAAELVLVIGLLAIIYSLATVQGYATTLAHEPFSGFISAVDQILSFFRPS